MNICTYPCFSFSFINVEQENLLRHLKRITSEDSSYSIRNCKFDFNYVFKMSARNPHLTSSVGFYRAMFIRHNDGFIMLSNLNDGWFTLCNSITYELKTSYYLFSIDEVEDEDTKNCMIFRDYSKAPDNTRCIYAMMDDRWRFFQEGAILWFENSDYYTRRKIKDRLNKKILLEYCHKIGINLNDDIFSHKECIILESRWN